ncbi:MAG: hypothetical protein ACI8W8_001896 [Rhodothermales bacterium]|jgi:hypothetical protein
MADIIDLSALPAEYVPPELRADSYFDFAAHPFAHCGIFANSTSVCDALARLPHYARTWLADAVNGRQKQLRSPRSTPDGTTHSGKFKLAIDKAARFRPTRIIGAESGDPFTVIVEAGAQVMGDLYVDAGSIYIGAGTVIEAGAVVKGPCILGSDCEVRSGAYLRATSVFGNACTLRGETKNVVMMDKAAFPHPSYVGDSLCGYHSHFGNQATAANFGIYAGMLSREDRSHITLRSNGNAYDLGTTKFGVCLGDFCQVGCNAVTDPGTFLLPRTIVYALARVSAGVYGPREVLKNKPLEHGIIERAELL